MEDFCFMSVTLLNVMIIQEVMVENTKAFGKYSAAY